MTRWLLTEEAVSDLDRLTDFLLQTAPEAAAGTVDLILEALQILASHPLVGRPLPEHLRELVISRGRTGYLALYRYDESADVALVLALRHQRESDYH
ncbi:type II toxin-antitoxin system RelE/ParE family toxin [Hydrogenophaga sp.]|uniref:type II toxin-antitoxin system RelE/ParE family toxin n=1 Tax=Hydrogenophaga sp. TaxID=1904254 RepID=UPI0027319D7B|nr:type II toxin-antitoxin system RelE/ParE family toxin [Hydrogenophaga sp.]MDP2015961.1 type II toxin-antitoxin system RelE/ParE family toxin [Hydrogenophaga sp.]MDP3167518.1 type II toxin-antitoxin system RelE/ParE family toxin [Hydrogenophaga sp.]MDP3812643.1 type II toxin-antitoxin system RelE/ParE family toxin [Hydrogenophaga sp.]